MQKAPCAVAKLHARVERFIQAITRQVLDSFVVLGHDHLDQLVRVFADDYNRERPPQPPEPSAAL